MVDGIPVKVVVLAEVFKQAEFLPVNPCERCDAPHTDVPFFWLHNPIKGDSGKVYNLWGLCPTLIEPMLAATSRSEVEFR
jgi:hypothetical protein